VEPAGDLVRAALASGKAVVTANKQVVAHYGPEHLARLGQIAQLQDRGLTIRAIADLLGRADRGQLELGEWLGLGERLQQPWSEDRPMTLSREALVERVGADRPGVIAALVRHGFRLESRVLNRTKTGEYEVWYGVFVRDGGPARATA